MAAAAAVQPQDQPAPLGSAASLDLEALKVWELGPFRLDAVEVEVLEGVRAYPEDVTRQADEHWQRMLDERPNLFDGPNWSLVKREASGDEGQRRLRLTLQKSSYRFMHFTHMNPQGRAQVPLASRCNGAGLMALTETSDGFLVFGLRSRKAGALPSHWHCVPAGVVDTPDPAAVLRKELEEEIGLDWAGVTAGHLLAMMSTGEEQGEKPELAFRLRLSISAAEVYALRQKAEDRAEHEALAFVRLPGRGDAAVAPAAVGGEVPAGSTPDAKDLFYVEPADFLGGCLGPLTEVSRRGLQLLLELGVPPIEPLAG